MSATGATERAAVLAAEQQLYRFLRVHLDPNETRDAVALAQNYARAVRAEERHHTRLNAQAEHEDRERREQEQRCLSNCVSVRCGKTCRYMQKRPSQ